MEKKFISRLIDVEYTRELDILIDNFKSKYMFGKSWSELNVILFDIKEEHQTGVFVTDKLRNQRNIAILANKIQTEKLDWKLKEDCKKLLPQVLMIEASELTTNSQ